MEAFKYTLDKGSKKFICPSCQKRTFVRFVDTEAGGYIAEAFGKCDRAQNCNYYKAPPKAQRFYQIEFKSIKPTVKALKVTAANGQVYFVPLSQVTERIGNSCYISEWYLKSSKIEYVSCPVKEIATDVICNTLTDQVIVSKPPTFHGLILLDELYNNSIADNFSTYLQRTFSTPQAFIATQRYFITGTDKMCSGSTIFWQIDEKEQIHAGKILQYDPVSGKRDKGKYKNPMWVHKYFENADFVLQQCLFGLHLLNEDLYKPIAVTESEKTAVIMSMVLPEYLWMACGGSGQFKADMLRPLQGRKVVYFPDKGLYNECCIKAKALQESGINVTVSDLLENMQSIDIGADLADVYGGYLSAVAYEGLQT